MSCVSRVARPRLSVLLDNHAVDLPDLPTDPNVVRRDRLLGALFATDPETSLLQHRPEFSLLVSPSAPPQIFLLPTRDRDARDRFPKLVAEIIRLANQGTVPTHIVAIGGGPDVVNALKKSYSTSARVPFGFHHVDDASRYAHVCGDKLEALALAGERIKHSEAPSAERIHQAVLRGRALVERDERALDKLGTLGPVTILLIMACGAAALFASVRGGWPGNATIIEHMGATKGSLVRGGDAWRLYASTFLHWDLAHILMNMYALYSLGRLLEPLLGPRRFFILYGLSGLCGALATTFLGSDRFSAGASGAIWGLMTAVLAVIVLPRNLLPPLLLARLKARALEPLVINVGLSFLPGIDLLAHFGGGICGFVLTISFLGGGLVAVDERQRGQDIETAPRPWLSVLAVLIALAMVASIVMGMVNARR